jgi:tetratricopeptide (TPR) repeat protein
MIAVTPRRFASLLVAAGLVFSAACKSSSLAFADEVDARTAYAKAMVLRFQRKSDQALMALRRAHKLETTNHIYFFGYAEALLNSGGSADHEELALVAERKIRAEPQSSLAHYFHARANYELGRYKKARRSLDRTLALQPSMAEAYDIRARTLDQLDESDLAVADHRQAVRLSPRSTEYRNQLAMHYYDEGDLDRALEHFSSLDRMESTAHSMKMRAEILFSLGRLDRAESVVTEAVQRGDANAATYILLGRLARNKGARAIMRITPEQAFRKALALDPNADMARYWIAGLRYDDGKYEEAFKLYSELKSVWPENVRLETDIGMSVLQQDKFGEAMTHFERASSLDKNDSEGLEFMALAFIRQKKYADAVLSATQAVARNPNSWTAYARRAHAQWWLQNLVDAQKDYATATQIEPEVRWLREEFAEFLTKEVSPKAAKMEIDAAMKMGTPDANTLWLKALVADYDNDLQTALRYYGEALRLRDNWPAMFADRAFVLLALDRPAQALADCERFLARAPNAPAAYRCRSRMLARLEKTELAIADLGKALEIDKDYTVALYDRGHLLHGQGRWEEAERDFTRVIELGYRLPESHFYRGITREEQGKLNPARLDYRKALKTADPSWAPSVSFRLTRIEAKLPREYSIGDRPN